MHLKRQSMSKSWPVFRKGTKYIVRPRFDIKNGVPLLVVLRDMLKLAQNRKEVKRAIHKGNILLNKKPATDEKGSILLFDTISIVPMKKHYRLNLGKGKFILDEINEKEVGKKIVKIVDKKILKGKRIQLNFSDGRNLFSDVKCNTGDSALVNIMEKKIDKIIPMKEKTEVFVFSGKHAGKTGKIIGIEKEKKTAEVSLEGKPVHVLIKQLIATA